MYPNLKLQLWVMGIRQNRLAQSLGMDESIVSKIINGFRTPSPEVRARIAGLLACDPEWLFESPGGHSAARSDAMAPSQGPGREGH